MLFVCPDRFVLPLAYLSLDFKVHLFKSIP